MSLAGERERVNRTTSSWVEKEEHVRGVHVADKNTLWLGAARPLSSGRLKFQSSDRSSSPGEWLWGRIQLPLPSCNFWGLKGAGWPRRETQQKRPLAGWQGQQGLWLTCGHRAARWIPIHVYSEVKTTTFSGLTSKLVFTALQPLLCTYVLCLFPARFSQKTKNSQNRLDSLSGLSRFREGLPFPSPLLPFYLSGNAAYWRKALVDWICCHQPRRLG